MKKLSIIIPAYNEEKTILEILKKVESVNLPLEKEIIIIDDGSRDKTAEILKSLLAEKYKVYFQEVNKGKGAAVRRGLEESTGDIVLIQDADMEYNPEEYPKLIKPILEGSADVVYGSRIIGRDSGSLFFLQNFANRFLTLLCNFFSGLRLTDMETCYKVFTRAVVDKIKHELSANRFGIEPDITIRVGKNKFRVCEIPISYNGRSYAQGKKINWKDGLSAIWHIIKLGVKK